MSLFDHLPHTLTAKAQSYAMDSYGGHTATEDAPQTGIEAWVQPASPQQINEFKSRDQRVTHQVFLQEDYGAKLDDVITVASGPSYVGLQLVIRGSVECTAGLGVGWMLVCDSDREGQ